MFRKAASKSGTFHSFGLESEVGQDAIRRPRRGTYFPQFDPLLFGEAQFAL